MEKAESGVHAEKNNIIGHIWCLKQIFNGYMKWK